MVLVPQGRAWSHQECLQPLKPALCTGMRSQQYGWILNAETQDLSSLNMLHIKKHPIQPSLEYLLTLSILQVLQRATTKTLATPTLRSGDEGLQD